MRLVRRLWTEDSVTSAGENFRVADSTVVPRIQVRGDRRHPKFYVGGVSEAAERVAATEADVQLFWGEPLDGVRERVDGLKAETGTGPRSPAAGIRPADNDAGQGHQRTLAVGQQRLLDLNERGDVLDDNLNTAPGKFGGGGAGTTWLVGSAEDVARSLRKYQDLGITHFVLSDTPYLSEIKRQGDQLLPLLRG
ncbi:LLM class flavin-dependent oxidoreductase (plasmid) [Rhizobium ruizarguesonis]|nr:LLM class flavin-dependent oxidoreductase [Rhizobium ruizarguesonis]